MTFRFAQFTLFAAVMALAPCAVQAGEKALMHCFAFTEIEDASEDEWKAFFEATDELPDKIDGLNKIWSGKLRRPLRQYNRDGEASVRQWGVCMELADAAALRTYAEHDAHSDWVKAYEKVRVAGTTTYDILGQ